MTVENRGNGHTWRMPANLIADTYDIVVLPYLSCSFTKVMRARETFILTFPTGDERTNEAWKIVGVASSKTFPISTEKIIFLTDHKVS